MRKTKHRTLLRLTIIALTQTFNETFRKEERSTVIASYRISTDPPGPPALKTENSEEIVTTTDDKYGAFNSRRRLRAIQSVAEPPSRVCFRITRVRTTATDVDHID
uniref:Secreted protein n=1 Tax=Plectus sambesii TaxID=2011161 RepID=A0A914XNP6_9BILA